MSSASCVLINTTCALDSNQAQKMDLRRFQELGSPRAAICLLHATSWASQQLNHFNLWACLKRKKKGNLLKHRHKNQYFMTVIGTQI